MMNLLKIVNKRALQWCFIDSFLVLLCFFCVCFGLVMITSASAEIATKTYHFEFYFLLRQAGYAFISFILMVLVAMIPINFWQKTSPILVLLSFFLLILVLLVGRSINGSVRWISLGIVNLQVSELCKYFLIMYLAGYLERHKVAAMTTWLGFIKPILVLVVVVVLLLLEPDFGAAIVLTVAYVGVLFLANLPFLRFIVVVLAGAVMLGLLAISQPYRMQRLATYMDPWQHQFSSGYQLTQSLIAFGRGSWFGEGLGNSIQKLFYLPEAHTDFVLAVIAEELGLAGVFLVLLLLMTIVYRVFKIARNAQLSGLTFASYVVFGIALLLGTQIIINIGVNIGLFPTKGLVLPFMSYGGSSLLANCGALGFVLRVEYQRRKSLSQGVPVAKKI